MKRAIIINIVTLMTLGIMKAAWELATEGQKIHGGKKSEYLGESMRQAWAVKKAGCTEESAFVAGGYELTQRQRDGMRKLKKQIILASQKAERNEAKDAAIMDEYFATKPRQKVQKPMIAESHDAYAEYATMPGINRKPTATKDYDFNQDIQGDYNQESFNDDFASQDVDDWATCKRCGMAALKADIRQINFTAYGETRSENCCGKCRRVIDLKYNGNTGTKSQWNKKAREAAEANRLKAWR